MSLMVLIVVVLLLCVAIWAVRTLMAAFALPQPIQAVIMVLIVVFFVLWVVSQLGLLGGGPVLRLR